MLVEVLEPSVLRMPELSDDAFFDFCASNDEYRIERTAEGRIIIMSGTGGETGFRNSLLTSQLTTWAMADGRGRPFDSSTMFLLPNSAMRSPDAAWVSRIRLAKLTSSQKRKYLPLCPEFVVELVSPSDRLPAVSAKMLEWIENGVQLGWVLDPDEMRAYVYRIGQPVEVLDNPAILAGEGPVDGFILDFKMILDSEL